MEAAHVVAAVAGGEVFRVAEAHKAAVDEDAEAITQALRFLHAVCRQHNRLVLLRALHDLPQLPPRCRVEAGGGLIEVGHLGAADERDRN